MGIRSCTSNQRSTGCNYAPSPFRIHPLACSRQHSLSVSRPGGDLISANLEDPIRTTSAHWLAVEVVPQHLQPSRLGSVSRLSNGRCNTRRQEQAPERFRLPAFRTE
ncbi:hypothetical protein LIA77_09327 [Sarocladium implicatum]|nr:hypothetical protein LIA77_09327 [Sarocladium implicatum]